MNPETTTHDVITGETITREMTDDEAAWFAANTSTNTFEETTPE